MVADIVICTHQNKRQKRQIGFDAVTTGAVVSISSYVMTTAAVIAIITLIRTHILIFYIEWFGGAFGIGLFYSHDRLYTSAVSKLKWVDRCRFQHAAPPPPQVHCQSWGNLTAARAVSRRFHCKTFYEIYETLWNYNHCSHCISLHIGRKDSVLLGTAYPTWVPLLAHWGYLEFLLRFSALPFGPNSRRVLAVSSTSCG